MTKPQPLGEGRRPGVIAANGARQVRQIERRDMRRYARIPILYVRAKGGDTAAEQELMALCESGLDENAVAYSALKSMEVNDMAGMDEELMDYNAEQKARAS